MLEFLEIATYIVSGLVCLLAYVGYCALANKAAARQDREFRKRR